MQLPSIFLQYQCFPCMKILSVTFFYLNISHSYFLRYVYVLYSSWTWVSLDSEGIVVLAIIRNLCVTSRKLTKINHALKLCFVVELEILLKP